MRLPVQLLARSALLGCAVSAAQRAAGDWPVDKVDAKALGAVK